MNYKCKNVYNEFSIVLNADGCRLIIIKTVFSFVVDKKTIVQALFWNLFFRSCRSIKHVTLVTFVN